MSGGYADGQVWVEVKRNKRNTENFDGMIHNVQNIGLNAGHTQTYLICRLKKTYPLPC
jgi:hypothetical protein